jgi:hypothetical protein
MNPTTPRPDAGRDPEQLERTADQIRADLDRTLDALERKLSPSEWLDRSLAYLRDHSGELSRNVSEAVRRNPVPIVLAVAGIGWLVAATFRSRSGLDDDTLGDESPYADPPPRRARFYDGVGNRFARAADATRERTRRTRHRVVSTIERQPILLGGLAIAVGALLGTLLPATEYEDKVVGKIRDRAVEHAKKVGERQYQNLRSRLETHRHVEVSGRAH